MNYSKLGLDNIEDANKTDVEELINTLNAKLKKLHHKEDEFNRNAALVPESDPNAAMINDKIM